jgi:uncharacterized membrane protein YqjE
MLGSLLKFVTFYLIGNRISAAKQDLVEMRDNAADYAESRAILIKKNVLEDVSRMVNSLVALLFMFCAVIFSGLLGMMWIFATAWDSPHRALILGVAIVIPLLISVIIFMLLKQSWKKKPLFNEATELIAQDWQIFRVGLDGTADTSEEANR